MVFSIPNATAIALASTASTSEIAERHRDRGGEVLADHGVAPARQPERAGVDRGAETAAQRAEHVAAHADGGGHEHEQAGERLEGAGDRSEDQTGEKVTARADEERDEACSDRGGGPSAEARESARRRLATNAPLVLGGSFISSLRPRPRISENKDRPGYPRRRRSVRLPDERSDHPHRREPRGPGEGLLERYLLDVCAVHNPRVCFVPTASGDSEPAITMFYERFPSTVCRPAHFTVFRPPAFPIAELLGDADIVYVGGGSTANMLAVWRLHGIDTMLRAAHERGATLTGSSAGANCWFESSVTDSFGNELAPLHDGLGLLPGSFCPHYDSEPAAAAGLPRADHRRGTPRGYAAEDAVAFHFRDSNLVEVVSARPDAAGYEVAAADGTLEERVLPTRVLG